MSALLALAAVALDALLGEPRRWHPLVGFGRIASALEARLNPGESASSRRGRALGVAALLLALLPPVASCFALIQVPALKPFVEVLVLYFALGHRSLREHALQVRDALLAHDLAAARERVGRMVSRDTGEMDERRVAAAAIESVLENGNDAVFGALFWFFVGGAPAVLGYRLANTLDAMWGYRTPRLRHYGWAAARFDDLLNWLPARLTALSYALLGRAADALRCWREQAPLCESPNGGPVMCSGAGSLGLALGGGAYYHGQWKDKPVIGAGAAPQAGDIARACRLVTASLALWLGCALAVESARALLQ